MQLTADALTTAPLQFRSEGLEARTFTALDRRLSFDSDRPVALALSGGGDSVALLGLTCAWARRRGRRVLALTVDHGLNPDSATWTRFAAEAARAEGADWQGLHWTGDKPATGLTAAARQARHSLIAEAAREAGAAVVLFAHTADDRDEADWMRARGSTLGHLREWSPSPVWPEGRGLMLLRPLLGERRAPLRQWLAGRGRGWIEDPGNRDPRFGRSRARLALSSMDHAFDPEPARAQLDRVFTTGAVPGLAPAEGVIRLGRDTGGRALAVGLVCAGGGSALPRLERLENLRERLRSGEDFVAALAGTRIEASGPEVLLMREPGDMVRKAIAPLSIPVAGAGVSPVVWDGRYSFLADAPGWTVMAADGHLARLGDQDRQKINGLPPAARRSAPVLVRDGEAAVCLAGRGLAAGVQQQDLVPQRVSLAMDLTPHEDDLYA